MSITLTSRSTKVAPVEPYHVPLTQPAFSYEPVAQRLMSRPFHPAAYPRDTNNVDPREETYFLTRGFPRNSGPVKPWIPGVSTPEGIIVTSTAVLFAADLMGPTGEAVTRALQGVAMVAMTSVVTGIPAAALWLGDSLFRVKP